MMQHLLLAPLTPDDPGREPMEWYCEPPAWRDENGVLTVTTAHGSDFWRMTHYGFVRDNGHFFFDRVAGDFTAEVKVTGDYAALYDQAGLMARLDETTWLKTGVEYVEGVQQLSAVVTRDFSDWSVTPAPGNPTSLWLRLTRRGDTVEVHTSFDGQIYTLLRLAYFPPARPVQVGPMACSPDGPGFTARFEGFAISNP